MRNRAFTLIELLVVIAIIAILAAILFPVFAQAKVAAKGAAAISNTKQVATALMTYEVDYDDNPPIVGNGDADAPFLLNGLPDKPWSYLLLPYSKSGRIWQDPLIQTEPVPAGWNADILYTYRTQIGYNYTVHAPVDLPNGWVYNSTPVTALGQPADTVLLTIKKSRQGNGDWLWVGGLIWGANIVRPPVCWQFYTDWHTPAIYPHSVCPPSSVGAAGWGSGADVYTGQTFEEGVVTGGVALRKAKQSIVAYADGHVKVNSPGYLAKGTNWTPTRAYNQVNITDITQYMWDGN